MGVRGSPRSPGARGSVERHDVDLLRRHWLFPYERLLSCWLLLVSPVALCRPFMSTKKGGKVAKWQGT